MSPVCIINAESGMEALTEDIPDLIDRSNISVVDFQDFADLRKMFDYFAFSKHGFKTLCLDTLDEILERAIHKWNRYYVPYSPEGLPLDRGNDDKMGLKIYNRATEEMVNLVRSFRDLPMNVIFTAHETNKPTEQNGPLRIRMDLTPALYGFVEGALSVIGRMQYKEIPVEGGKEEETELVRIITFRSGNDILKVKDRTPGQKLGRVMVNPTMKKLWDRRMGKDA